MEPKSHKRRNFIILLIVIVILVLILVRKKDLGLNVGSGRLSEEEKAALIEQLSQQPGSSQNLTPAEKEAVMKKIQTSSSGSSSVTLTEEQKAEIIKEVR